MNASKEKKTSKPKVKKNSSSSKATPPPVVDVPASIDVEGDMPASDIPSKKAVGISIAISVLSNILTDLLKPDSGWVPAMHKVGEMLGNLPFTNFLALSKQNTAKKVTKKEYNLWINSILVAMVDFQRQSFELRKISEEFDVSYEDIASLAAKRLFESAGSVNGLNYFDLKAMINSYFLYQYLQASIPLDVAKKIGRKMRI